MGDPNVQGNFIDDEWFDNGPELEGPGSQSAVHDTGIMTSIMHMFFDDAVDTSIMQHNSLLQA